MFIAGEEIIREEKIRNKPSQAKIKITVAVAAQVEGPMVSMMFIALCFIYVIFIMLFPPYPSYSINSDSSVSIIQSII
jgi:hypothetical protein